MQKHKCQRAHPKKQPRGCHKEAQSAPLLIRALSPSQRRSQCQPHQRNVGQDTERVLHIIIARRQRRHGGFMHEGEVSGPARRLQKVHQKIEPEITHIEELHHELTVSAQFVVLSEFERVVEPQVVVVHQPQPNQRDRSDGCYHRGPNPPPFTPRHDYRHQQDNCAKQQRGPRANGQSVGHTRRDQPPTSPFRIMQRAPNRPQCQHRQHIPATDRHLVNVGLRQQHRHARRQAERQRAQRHHADTHLREIAPPERAQQAQANGNAHGAENCHGQTVRQVVAGQRNERPE